MSHFVLPPGTFGDIAASPSGSRLDQLLVTDEYRAAMRIATELGHPAVAGIESLLLRDFAEDATPIFQDRVKQYIGFRTRQIMEQMGYVLSQSKVKIGSILFYAGARYKQRDSWTYYVWQRASNPKKIALTADKHGERLPGIEPDCWIPLKPFTGAMHGVIVYGLKDEAVARKEIAEKGYFEYSRERLLRAA